jgi:hypothetical protein
VTGNGFDRLLVGGFGVILMIGGIHKDTLLFYGMPPAKHKPKYHPSKGQRICLLIGGGLMIYMAATNQM